MLAVAVPSLSVVMPVRNEAEHLPGTFAALLRALDGSGFDAEVVLVDDGSTDDSADIARRSLGDRLPLRVVAPVGRGRLAARSSGLEVAQADVVLLLDGRVRLEPGSLRFVRERVESGESVWNAHVHVEADDDFGVFWQLLAELAWRDYFDDPRTTSFGAEDFDRFPKGTTCFLAPRRLLQDAFASFTTRYHDVQLANDDTPALRWVAERQRIWISPQFACVYLPRTNAASFFRHAVRRGAVFVDGHGRPESRFFPAVVAFFPLSAALALRRPQFLPAAVAACGVAAAAYGVSAGRSPRELRVLLTVTPLYAVGHALGMWRGAAELLR